MTSSSPTTEPNARATPEQNRKRFILFALLVVLIALAGSLIIFSIPSKKSSSPHIHATAHASATNFTAETLDKTSTLTLSQFRGRPVVLNFWASWCVPCQAEFGTIKSMHGLYSGVEMIGILTQDNATDGATFARKQHADWPLVYDRGQRISADYKVTSLPQTVFINANGVIVDRVFGQLSTSDFQRNFV